MHRIQRIRRTIAVLSGLALAWVGLAVAAPAAFAMVPADVGSGGTRRPSRPAS